MKYTVSMRVRGYYSVDVEAESLEEAKKLGEQAWSEADFGELECIDGEAYSASKEDSSEEYYFM